MANYSTNTVVCTVWYIYTSHILATSTLSTVRSFIYSFIHYVACVATGPKPFTKRVLQRVRSSASSFKFQDLLFSLRLYSSCLRARRLFVLSTNFLYDEPLQKLATEFSVGFVQNGGWQLTNTLTSNCQYKPITRNIAVINQTACRRTGQSFPICVHLCTQHAKVQITYSLPLSCKNEARNVTSHAGPKSDQLRLTTHYTRKCVGLLSVPDAWFVIPLPPHFHALSSCRKTIGTRKKRQFRRQAWDSLLVWLVIYRRFPHSECRL